MEIGMVGLGRMGANMARRLMRRGQRVVAWNRSFDRVEDLAREGAGSARTLEELVQRLAPPRAAWLMLPAGAPTEEAVHALGRLLAPGDVLIDGGNTNFRDDVRRAKQLAPRGIAYVDVGTSGGVHGLERGYCLMIGGEAEIVRRLEPAFAALAPGEAGIEPVAGRERRAGTASRGWLHCGPAGAGHFVKMVHNGIEYGLMQAYAEGFEILREARSDKLPEELRYRLDLADIAELWRRGSVVGSWLLDLTARALADDGELSGYSGQVADSGEGRWALQAAIDEDVPADALAGALFRRFRSRQSPSYADKLLSAMRAGFGGHREPGAS